MFPASFYQPASYYRAPSPDPTRHRAAVPFTIATLDTPYDTYPAPQAYATAEASVLEHLHRQAHLDALRAREREWEKQRRLARLAALEEAQHREYHQRRIVESYFQSQARARAQQEAERQQRERQRQYEERARAIAAAQQAARERAERARLREIERRREEARQRIFVRDLMDSLFADVQPQQVPQQRLVQSQQDQPRFAQHPAGYRVAQPQLAQPHVAQPQIQRQPARIPQQAQRQLPQTAQQASPDSEQEAFERFLNSFFGVASPQIAKPPVPVPAVVAQPSAPESAIPRPETDRSVTFQEPVEAQPQPQVATPKPAAEPKAIEQPVMQSAPIEAPSAEDELTKLLSSVLGVPVNVKNVELRNNAASPPIVSKASPPPPTDAHHEASPPRAASPIQRPSSPTPEKQSTPAKSPVVSQPEEEELSEDFKAMVDRVFKDLERVFGVVPEQGGESKKEAVKEEPVKEAGAKVPEEKETQPEAEAEPEAEAKPQVTSEAKSEVTTSEAKPETKFTEPTLPSSVETSAAQETVEPLLQADPTPVAAPVPIPDELSLPSEDQSATEISTEMLDADSEDDIPACAADLQDTKAARAATLIQQKYRKHHARVQRLEKLESLKAKLDKLVNGFTFPTHLDFQDPDSEHVTPSLDPVDGASHDGDERVTPVPPLSFTHNNAPYHAHAQALLSLLVAADAISSDGDKEVRSVRKAFVKEVEEKLAEMERQRSAVFRRQQSEQEATGETAKDEATESQGDSDSTPTVTPLAAVETDSSAQEQPEDHGATTDDQPSTFESTRAMQPEVKEIEEVVEMPSAPEAVVVTDEKVLTAPIEQLMEPGTPAEPAAPVKSNAPPRPTVEDERSSQDDFVMVDK